MSILAADFQNLIISSLAQADPSALDGLRHNVPSYWTLHNRQSYLPELQYFYTLRDGIRYLQACLNQEVDYQRRTGQLNRTSLDSSRQDATSTANSLETSKSVGSRNANSQFDDVIDSTGSAESNSYRTSNQSRAADSTMDDAGTGASLAQRYMSSTSKMRSTSHVKEVTKDDHDLTTDRKGTGSRDMAILQKTYYNTALSFLGFGGFDNEFPGVQQITQTLGGLGATGSPPDAISSITTNSVTDDTYSTLDTSRGPQSEIDPYRKTSYALTLVKVTTTYPDMSTVDDLVPTQHSETAIYDHPTNHGVDYLGNTVVDANTPSSSTTFTANTTQVSSSVTSASTSANANATSSATTTGTGTGANDSYSSGEATLNATTTRIAHSDGESHRSAQALGGNSAIMERLHQRFLHLQDLYAACDAMIKWIEAQRLSLSPYTIRQMVRQYPLGFDANVANSILVQQPYGYGVTAWQH